MNEKRSLEDRDDPQKAKRQARAGNQRKWTMEEVTSILDYLKGTILKNEQLEKPTALAYYDKLNTHLKLSDATAVKIRAKVQNLRNSYVNAITWRGKTGQGVSAAEGPEAVMSYILKICPYFKELDEIYGSKASVHPPYIHDSGSTHEEEGLLDLSADDTTSQQNYSETRNEMSIPPVSQSTSGVELMKSKLEAGISKARPQKKDALTLLSETQSQRTEMLAKKIEVEEKRLESEIKWKERELELTEKKLDNEKELKLLELEKDERIAKFKIESEVKLQIEMAKLKYSMN